MQQQFFHGNWVDFFILIIIFFYLYSGWSRGLVVGMLDLAGFVFSFVSALKLYSYFGLLMSNNFSIGRGISNALGFLLAGLLTEIAYSFLFSLLIRKIYSKFTSVAKNKKRTRFYISLDKALGFIPALGESFIFIAFILTLAITLPVAGRIKNDIVTSTLGGPLIERTQGIERHLNKIFGEAVNETLTFLTINPSPSSLERIDLGFVYTKGKADETAETSMYTLINIERNKANLPPLKLSLQLRELARKYAKDMFERGYFSHYNPEGKSPFDRMREENIIFFAAGENLALAPNVVLAHQGLMNSEGHRANILSSEFGSVGVGVIDGGIYGALFVQEFTD